MARLGLFWVIIVTVIINMNIAIAAKRSGKSRKWHSLVLGFNLTYPDRVTEQETALKAISEHGIQHVRLFEIFNGKTDLTYQQRLGDALDVVLKYDMLPMLTISNVPAVLLPDSSQRSIINHTLPLSVAGKIDVILNYSNRYPPYNLIAYRNELQNLIDFLFHSYSRKQVLKWFIEIANEPDAPLYYWGPSAQFRDFTSVAFEVFRENGFDMVGGYGMTQNIIFQTGVERNNNLSFKNIMQNYCTKLSNEMFISFHLYKRKDQKSANVPLVGFPVWLAQSQSRKIISEWNVSSIGKKASKIFSQPGTWGKMFLWLLNASYHNNIDAIYLFKLMDSVKFSALQLGAFDSLGKPKEWYGEFMAIWQVIRFGYCVETFEEDGLILHGKNGDVIILTNDKPAAISNYKIRYTPYRRYVFPKNTVEPEEWAILTPTSAN